MIRGFGNAVILVVIASLLDKFLNAGHYTEAAAAMLLQIRYSFGF